MKVLVLIVVYLVSVYGLPTPMIDGENDWPVTTRNDCAKHLHDQCLPKFLEATGVCEVEQLIACLMKEMITTPSCQRCNTTRDQMTSHVDTIRSEFLHSHSCPSEQDADMLIEVLVDPELHYGNLFEEEGAWFLEDDESDDSQYEEDTADASENGSKYQFSSIIESIYNAVRDTFGIDIHEGEEGAHNGTIAGGSNVTDEEYEELLPFDWSIFDEDNATEIGNRSHNATSEEEEFLDYTDDESEGLLHSVLDFYDHDDDDDWTDWEEDNNDDVGYWDDHEDEEDHHEDGDDHHNGDENDHEDGEGHYEKDGEDHYKKDGKDHHKEDWEDSFLDGFGEVHDPEAMNDRTDENSKLGYGVTEEAAESDGGYFDDWLKR